MWVTAALHLFGQAIGLANNLTSGDNAEKRFHVAMRKDARKALDVAEDIFDLVDDELDSLPERFQKKYKKLKTKFNHLD